MNNSDVTRVPESHCLHCGCKMDALDTGDPNDTAPPSPGEIAVCIKCGAVMILDYELKLRALTGAEVDALLADHATMDQVARTVRTVRYTKHARG